MSKKQLHSKTQGAWTMSAEELCTKLGFPKIEEKTGSLIMPAPRHSQSVKQQQDSHNQPRKQKE